MVMVVREGELYRVAEEERLPAGMKRSFTRARWTGEHRAPRAGEWFLSGAIVEAYRASNDLMMEYHIAELVEGTVTFPGQ